ncbi:tetratricopeptide repeat protein [Ferruginibacter sp.]|nr:tetratricopeptide repeat protein [Ferruginibacter sp.]
MKKLVFILIIFSASLITCAQNTTIQKRNNDVYKLSLQTISLIGFLENEDSCKKAVFLLDSATKLNNSCFLCYYNKAIFLNSLNQYNEAITSIKHAIRIKPLSPDLYFNAGLLYEKINDSSSAREYFRKSLQTCESALDTMNINHPNYAIWQSYKAATLVLLGEQSKAYNQFEKLYNSQSDEILKNRIKRIMNSSRVQVIKMFTIGSE